MECFKKEIEKIICQKLLPLVDRDYVFLDLPYYTNIGDILIWEGTEAFLKGTPHNCLYKSSIETYITPKISESTIILLQGGGNFGDLWRRHNDFCLKVLQEFPKNKAIILPKTVFYEDKNKMLEDAKLMAKHPSLTICARDEKSYKLLTKYFHRNKIILIPDMAFFIPQRFLEKHKKKEENRGLFLKRKDKELCSFDYNYYLGGDDSIEEHDWPTMEYNFFFIKVFSFFKKIQKNTKKFNKLKYINYITSKAIDLYAIKIYMPRITEIGIQFLSTYKIIYTTRLHGAILGFLLEKPITLFDNSYGKNESFYNTWAKGVSSINFIEKNKNE